MAAARDGADFRLGSVCFRREGNTHVVRVLSSVRAAGRLGRRPGRQACERARASARVVGGREKGGLRGGAPNNPTTGGSTAGSGGWPLAPMRRSVPAGSLHISRTARGATAVSTGAAAVNSNIVPKRGMGRGQGPHLHEQDFLEGQSGTRGNGSGERIATRRRGRANDRRVVKAQGGLDTLEGPGAASIPDVAGYLDHLELIDGAQRLPQLRIWPQLSSHRCNGRCHSNHYPVGGRDCSTCSHHRGDRLGANKCL